MLAKMRASIFGEPCGLPVLASLARREPAFALLSKQAALRHYSGQASATSELGALAPRLIKADGAGERVVAANLCREVAA